MHRPIITIILSIFLTMKGIQLKKNRFFSIPFSIYLIVFPFSIISIFIVCLHKRLSRLKFSNSMKLLSFMRQSMVFCSSAGNPFHVLSIGHHCELSFYPLLFIWMLFLRSELDNLIKRASCPSKRIIMPFMAGIRNFICRKNNSLYLCQPSAFWSKGHF